MSEHPCIIKPDVEGISASEDDKQKESEPSVPTETKDVNLHVKNPVRRRILVEEDVEEEELIIKKRSPRINMQQIIDKIKSHPDEDIKLLRDEEVVRWIFGDTGFLNISEETKNRTNDDKKRKINEDSWGWSKYNDIIKPSKEISRKQWTTCFGQTVGKELYLLQNSKVWKPKKKNKYEPDLENDSCVVEVKTQTFFTSGTAGEKILGSPFKYASIPRLFGKPLIILCIGGAEKISREMYGNLGAKANAEQRKMLKFLSDELSIKFEGAMDILKRIVN